MRLGSPSFVTATPAEIKVLLSRILGVQSTYELSNVDGAPSDKGVRLGDEECCHGQITSTSIAARTLSATPGLRTPALHILRRDIQKRAYWLHAVPLAGGTIMANVPCMTTIAASSRPD